MFIRRAEPVLTRYKDLNGTSNVRSYELRHDGIIVKFKKGEFKHALFNNTETGVHLVENLKFLAERGAGLDTYINNVVKERYYRRW